MSTKRPLPLNLDQLMSSEKYSDLDIVCDGHVFKVHKAIVCTQSPVLAAACDGTFKEATTGSIHINEFDAKTVKRMIEFMYTNEYDDVTEEQASEDLRRSKHARSETLSQEIKDRYNLPSSKTTHIVLKHVLVNAIADCYDIPQLKALANTKIQHILDTTWHADGYCDVIKAAFASTSDAALREIIASAAAVHIEELIKLEDFAAMDIMNDFASKIIGNIITAYKDKELSSSRELGTAKSLVQDNESRVQSAEQDCSHEKFLRERATTRADHAIENIDGCLKTLSTTMTCRNVRCSAEFSCYIERSSWIDEPKYTLRCSKCRCRHYSTGA